MSNVRISVMLPTRGRAEALTRSIGSLLERAEDPASLEFLLGIDSDDRETIETFLGLQANVKAVVMARVGYSMMKEYWNRLSAIATGDWIFMWNDDALMQTDGWDSVIAALPPCVGCPQHNLGPGDEYGLPLNTFPAVPREWVRLVGHYCLDSAGDTWWQEIGTRTGTQLVIPLVVYHDHPLATSIDADATFAEHNYDPSGFYSEATQALIQRDADLLHEWITANESQSKTNRSNDVLVIVPTRSRPGSDTAFSRAFFAHSTRSDLLFALDEDDPRLTEYRGIPGVQYEVNPRLYRVGTLNLVANKYLDHYDYIAVMSDEHRIRTPAWDQQLVEAITDLPAGIAYGNDLLPGDPLPSAVLINASIVRRLGYIAPPALMRHCTDAFWRDLGQVLGTLQYRENVIIEHRHVAAGTAAPDALHEATHAAEALKRDLAAYDHYSRTRLGIDARRLALALNSGTHHHTRTLGTRGTRPAAI